MGFLLLTQADFANLSLLDGNRALRRLLAQAEVVPSDAMPPDVVTMNTQLVVVEMPGERRRVLRVVFPADADPGAGRLAVTEPLGMALLGARAGQVVHDGERRLRVEQVLYQPEHSLRTHLVLRR